MMRNSATKKQRSIPENRKKYGKPETRKEALKRLQTIREAAEKKVEIQRKIEKKNKDEFYFAFYSLDKSLVRKKEMGREELLKAIRYIDREIRRSENILKETVLPKFVGRPECRDKSEKEKHQREYEEYIEQLVAKRQEAVGKLAKFR